MQQGSLNANCSAIAATAAINHGDRHLGATAICLATVRTLLYRSRARLETKTVEKRSQIEKHRIALPRGCDRPTVLTNPAPMIYVLATIATIAIAILLSLVWWFLGVLDTILSATEDRD